MADPGLPAAQPHELVIFGDPPRRAENETPGKLGSVLVAAPRPAGAADGDPGILQRGHVERGVAHPGGDQEFQVWQPFDDAPWEGGTLAHRANDLTVGQRADNIILVGEREPFDRDLDTA